jgi:glyoxylase-like metal-dependent hydrolase (beta-lactamase superfamily II)
VHQADAARARGDEKPPPNARGPMKIGPLLGFLWYAGRRGGLRTRHLGEVRPLQGGETLELPGAPRVISLPGHSPGSVAYHLPALDAIAVGDAFTTRNVLTGEVAPGPAPFTDDPAQALASLDALDGIEARWVLPGHGPVWDRGLAEALRLVRERSR